MLKYAIFGIYIGLTIPAVLAMFCGIFRPRVEVKINDDKDESEEDTGEEQ